MLCGRFSYSTPRKQQSTEEAPSPISDEEQRLNRRQRCTLSQLRSGHCHLLQDYKHRVFGEPSDTCTDCGASPQDVRHLFACTTHPTGLSPEDLWRNPVRSIRAFIYLDNGKLDRLEDGPGRGKQQQQHTPSKLLHKRMHSISGSSYDDDGHPHTRRLQRSPLIVVFKFYRCERHYVGEHGVWL